MSRESRVCILAEVRLRAYIRTHIRQRPHLLYCQQHVLQRGLTADSVLAFREKNIYPEIIKFRVHLERWIARSAPLGVACHHSVLRANSLYCFPFLATNRPAMPWELVRFGRLFSGVGLLISQPSRFLLRALLHLTPTCLFCWSCCHRHRRH